MYSKLQNNKIATYQGLRGVNFNIHNAHSVSTYFFLCHLRSTATPFSSSHCAATIEKIKIDTGLKPGFWVGDAWKHEAELTQISV